METLLEEINKLYNTNVHSFEKVTEGFLTENYILFEDNKKYFLKKYRFKEKEKIEEIHSVKKYFKEGGIPIIFPLVNKNSSTFFCFKNEYFALFPFVEGKQFKRGSLTDVAIVSLGEMLGKIHLLGKNAKLPIREKFKPWDKEKVLEKIKAIELEINKKEILSDLDKLVLETINIKKHLVTINSTTFEDLDLLSDHLIHGDYLDKNVFFNDNDKVSFVFDFEKAYFAPRVYELIRSMIYSCISDDFNHNDFEKAKLYLNSYLKIYPAEKKEIEKGLRLYYLKAIHGVWAENEYYIKNNHRIDMFLLSSYYRIKYFSEHLEELKSYFLD